MEELLSQTLRLTLWGMGMTFASIGILVLGMYLMTYLTRERREEEGDVMAAPLEREAVEVEMERERKRKAVAAAVAAAVAVALAQGEQQPAKPVALPTAMRALLDEPWNAYARGLHVLRRQRYEAHRWRR